MSIEEAKAEINKVFEPAFANYIITALTEGAIPSERRWIPVSERLPDKGGLYFVTKENDYGKYVSTEWFYQDNTWSTGWKVIAWMPMPKPYEEGE